MMQLHIVLETVALGGNGFTPHVTDGQRVAAGDMLIDFDLDRLARTAKSLITPVVVTTGDAFRLRSAICVLAVATGAAVLVLDATGAAGVTATPESEPAAPATRALSLPLAQGLHARPAARVAALAGEHPGSLEIVGPTGRAASARSAVALLSLALPHGAAITVRGDDRAGVDALADLLVCGLGVFLAVFPLLVACLVRAVS